MQRNSGTRCGNRCPLVHLRMLIIEDDRSGVMLYVLNCSQRNLVFGKSSGNASAEIAHAGSPYDLVGART